MIINFTTADGDDVCIADCISFRTSKNNSMIIVEREAEISSVLKYKFPSPAEMYDCYQTMIESARKWAES